jgi:hypothetical protein
VLVWKVWELAQSNGDHRVTSSNTARVMDVLRDCGTRNKLEARTNPIRRGSIGVSGIDTELYMYKICGDDDGDGDNN